MSIKIKEKTQIEKIDESNINYKIAYNSKNNKFNYLGNWLEKESTIFVNETNNKKNNKPNNIEERTGFLHKAAYRRFYIDEIYLFITHKIIFQGICRPIAWFDRHIIDGTMDMFANVTQCISARIKGLQSGSVQGYVWLILIGSILIAAITICCCL